MFVVTNKQIAGTEREVHCPRGGFVSFRYLLQSDGMGFGLHRTEIPKGKRQHWHYKRHREACYCIQGRGLLTDAATGKIYEIVPGTCYVLNNHDDHYFQATEDVVLISVFNPPCTGFEVHGEDGSY
jgi:L-ectoine synthase